MKVDRRRILLGITGSIAAYKGAELARKLTERGFRVTVVLTEAGARFVSALTFEALTGSRSYSDMFVSGEMLHIRLERENDLIVIAPATADFIAKMAHGLGDDLLSAIVLSRTHPVLVAPAMNSEMYLNAVVQKNISFLRDLGMNVLPTGEGGLACGETGPGRMLEPDQIVEAIIRMLSEKDFEGRKVVVTAGPTREPLDDVRFITNASTGRMGYAIALAALRRGADTTLVTGPCETTPPEGADIRRVTTAREMREHTLNTAAAADFVFMAAAVSDYAPARPLKGKPPKEQIGRIMHLELKRNPDILSDLARRKGKPSRVTIGFAAEWGKPDLARVQRKFVSKGLNGLFVNDISQTDIGFGSQVNEGWWLNEKGILVAVPRMPKEDLADILLDYALEIAGCKGQASRISSANPRR